MAIAITRIVLATSNVICINYSLSAFWTDILCPA